MRNFLAFLRQFRVLLFFALLQGIALTWYFTYLEYPRSQYLTAAASVSGKMYEWRFNVTQYLNLEKNNSWLQKENARLQERQLQNVLQLEQGLVKIDDTLHKVQYEYIPAKVINSTHTRRNNYFTLNVGTNNGIEKNMGVFSPNGVLGTVHSVGEHYSIVKSCLTENINIALMIESSGEHGFLKWDGRDPRRGSLTGISNDRKVKKWSKVVTRGSAGIFPQGLMVGKVEKTAPIEGKPLWDVTILFSENYRSVQRVYVIKNLLKQEQLELEAPYQNAE
jgi:rod shape-determining protein MreC